MNLSHPFVAAASTFPSHVQRKPSALVARPVSDLTAPVESASPLPWSCRSPAGRHRARHVGAEREPPSSRVERIRRPRLDDVDAPSSIDLIDGADIKTPPPAVAQDRAAFDRLAPEVLARRARDRLETFAITSSDSELPATARARPAQAIDEENAVAVTKRAGCTSPVAHARSGRWFDKDRRRCVERRVHFPANFS